MASKKAARKSYHEHSNEIMIIILLQSTTYRTADEMHGRGEETASPPHHKPWAVGTNGLTQRREELSLLPEQQRGWKSDDLLCCATRGLTYKKV